MMKSRFVSIVLGVIYTLSVAGFGAIVLLLILMGEIR